MAKVVEYVEGRYEVEDAEFGTVYRWCPENVVVECDCSETLTLAPETTTCHKCAKDHAPLIGEVSNARSEDEIDRPWRSPNPYYEPTRGT